MTATLHARPQPAAAGWRAIGTQVQLVVTDPGQLEAGRLLLAHELAVVDLACSRWREDSELLLAERAAPAPVHVSAALADAVGAALLAADLTDGDLDPTVVPASFRAAGRASGYGLELPRRPSAVTVSRHLSWRAVRLDDRTGVLTLPAGVRLDVGTTAKARAADVAAARLSDQLGCGVLVGIGGELAVAGEPPDGGWRVLVHGRSGQSGPVSSGLGATVPITAGLSTCTSTSKRWRDGSVRLHHALDPRRGLMAGHPAWRMVSVLAGTALHASIASAAALIRGRGAVAWLDRLGLSARLVAGDGTIRTVGAWPRAGDRA